MIAGLQSCRKFGLLTKNVHLVFNLFKTISVKSAAVSRLNFRCTMAAPPDDSIDVGFFPHPRFQVNQPITHIFTACPSTPRNRALSRSPILHPCHCLPTRHSNPHSRTLPTPQLHHLHLHCFRRRPPRSACIDFIPNLHWSRLPPRPYALA